MKPKKYKYLTVLFIAIALISACGEKEPDYVNIWLHFEAKLKVYPTKDTINIGDTIWIEANIPDTLLEITRKQYYKIDRKYLSGLLSFQRLVNPATGLAMQDGVADTYGSEAVLGTLGKVSSSFIRYNFETDDALGRFKFAFIPKVTGVHHISTLTDSPGTYGTLQSHIELGLNAEGKKQVARIERIYFRFNEAGSGYHIFKQHCYAVSEKTDHHSATYIERDGAYTFVVK
ncbi:hypothetical protein [Chitinophaga alhagiae]|uniref:hypothetical protein n=1 Tax=Chitinophaga alhagiae TaxID=2203219 RepID=UPI000E5B050B|nr:hypothetical protein [Chitinophaga alhagiae]